MIKNCIDNHANINEAMSSLMAMETILVFGLENAIWATPRLSSAILIFMLTPSYEDTCKYNNQYDFIVQVHRSC